MVPAYYAPSIDRRVTPEERLEDVEKKFRVFVDMIASEYPEVRVEVMTTNKLNPTLMNPEPRIVNPVRSATEAVLGYSPRTTISLGGLGMRYYTEVSIEAVTYRPGGLGMTHVADEYLSIEELEKWVMST